MSSNKPSIRKLSTKKNRIRLKEYFDFRNNQINQIGLIFFSAFVISTTLIYVFNERFSENRWNDNPKKRYQMVDDIKDRNLFINDTKYEVLKQLGKPNDSLSAELIQYNYYIGKSAKFSSGEIKQLSIIFKKDTVIKVMVTSRTD